MLTTAQIKTVITEQLAQPYPFSDNLRTAVMYLPTTMTAAQWGAACRELNINADTARKRRNEVVTFWKQTGELR